MKKYLILVLVLYACISFSHCQKITEEEKLPSASTVGANTFGCLVDGKAWIPYSAFDYKISMVYNVQNRLSIYSKNRRDGEKSDIEVTVDNVTGAGTYKVYNKLDEGLIYSNEVNYEPWDTFGIVNITRYDTIQKVISGTFSFIGKNKQFNKSVNITEGRFDFAYPYQK